MIKERDELVRQVFARLRELRGEAHDEMPVRTMDDLEALRASHRQLVEQDETLSELSHRLLLLLRRSRQ